MDAEALVAVVVRRTGGVAGLRREWRVEPAARDTERWIALIGQCPWDAVPEKAEGADRFVWRIRARCGVDAREAELPDRDVRGPWRDLVNEVRGYEPPQPEDQERLSAP